MHCTHRAFVPEKGKMSSNKDPRRSQIRWRTPVIPALRRLKQEDFEFQASLDYSETLNINK
jgi:hypothetical protein